MNTKTVKDNLLKVRSQNALRQWRIEDIQKILYELPSHRNDLKEIEKFFREYLRSLVTLQTGQIYLSNLGEDMIAFAEKQQAAGELVISAWLFNTAGGQFDGYDMPLPAVRVTPEVGKTFCLNCLGSGEILNPEPESDDFVDCVPCKSSGVMYFGM